MSFIGQRRIGVRVLWVFAVAALLLVSQIQAQVPRGTLVGNVQDAQGASLPGVTITATSDKLQGARTTTTGINGDYKLVSLPAGVYKVSYELDGFATAVTEVKVSAAQTGTANIEMQLSEISEEIIVTSLSEQISETGTAATTFTKDEVENLAIDGTILQTVNLAPGVHDTGVSTAPSINGAMTFENLFMINGVPNMDNVRGTPLPLFIEDAVQETTVATSGVSAEYGRFTGGVVNVLTKSGGNQFSGSLRINYENNDWESKTPLSNDRIDDISHEDSATLGGYLWKDHVWFFGARRERAESTTDQLAVTNITYPTTDDEERTEGKLTLSATPSHSVVGSYIEIARERANSNFVRELDLQSLTNRTDPQELKSGNYTGILSANFFVEAQHSERDFTIAKGSGGPSPTQPGIEGLIPGTMIRDRPTAHRWHSPTFCGDCVDNARNAENSLIKGSYFLATEGGGTHDLVFGYDSFEDITFNVNHQTGSDFQVWGNDYVVGPGNEIFPVWANSGTWLVWWPPIGLDIAQPASFKTNSLYANDSWQLNDKWSFNIGVRYDDNDGVDSSGNAAAQDNKVSPRLGLSYDTKGDGDLVINASYGTYVAALASSGNIGDGASTGGALAGFAFPYTGTPINVNCTPDGANCTSNEDALRQIFEWYFANGGTNDIINGDLSQLPPTVFGCIPGASNILPPGSGFTSPNAQELTVGVTKRLGSKGLFRADVIYRDWDDFYSELTDAAITGTADTPAGVLDVTYIGNFGNSQLTRDYVGVNVQSRYRFTDKLTVAGNWTLSELDGNINGETGNSGPVPLSPNSFPEYKETRWNTPTGNLLADQRHKVRVWGVYDILDSEHQSLNVSLLQNYFGSQPLATAGAVDSRPFVTNPGYASPPTTVIYHYVPRGSVRGDDIWRTDVALNYGFSWNLFGRSVEVFIQPEIINLFDNAGVIDPDSTVLDNTTSGNFATFNPFTETPVQGTHWDFGDDFGDALDEDDFQDPRTYRFSLGFRF
jgi:hypothetical protein